ncbi:M14 family zinc carboxypeptidase [Euzebya rosea]|uniref:M14 family zinc carboxypeptidase n=1 Tax=Euzebya rosea TaxID=2052804 RepID=UPI000D3E17A5|nr:M14 family zinc carboxypeptidase [Euzebya rosea]
MPRPTLRSALAALTMGAVALAPTVGLGAGPSMPSATDAQIERAAAAGLSLDGADPTRVFPDPIINGDFLQYTDGTLGGLAMSYLTGLDELENRYSVTREDGAGAFVHADICTYVCDLLEAGEISVLDARGAIVDDEGVRKILSAGGREMPVVTVTAPDSSEHPVEERLDLYFSMSIHGAERAGAEGGVRYIEDLLIAFEAEQLGTEPVTGPKVLTAGDPANPDYAEYSVTEVLQSARLHFIAPNPDGWADGDRNDGRGLYHRGNDNGRDLNRQFPTQGWHNAGGQQYNTGNENETKALQAFIEDYLGTPQGAADLHGEFADNVLLAIMFPAGQFDPLALQGQYRLAEAIKYNVNTSVHPGAAGLLATIGMGEVQPAEYHTAYDAIGYDDSGFQGDYLVQQGILEMDHEYILSNLVPSSVFVPELEQVHVDTTRALLDATIALTLKAYGVGVDVPAERADRRTPGLDYTVDMGGARIGYVYDAETITDEDVENEPPFGLPQADYASTNMTYFEDVQTVMADVTMEPIEDVTSTDLSAFDRIVVADDSLRIDDVDGWAALEAWTRAGGDLVLTDSALQALEVIGAVPADSVERVTQYAGEISEVDRDHPLLDGVGGIIRQTYFEVPLGYRMNTAPAWYVDADAWTGDVAATIGATTASMDLLVTSTYGNATDDVVLAGGEPTLGSMALDDGRVTIFGAILPDAGNVGPNTHGLADYAVTYAGNGILMNILKGL